LFFNQSASQRFDFSDLSKPCSHLSFNIKESPFRRFPQFPIIRREKWKWMGFGDVEVA
jgi:hypothetical protein